VRHTHSLHGGSAALTQITTAAGVIAIDIPAGRGGILTSVSLSVRGTIESAVCSGGLVELDNTESDWYPFFVPTGFSTALTQDGDALKPMVYDCFKKLPGNSQVIVNYTPMDDQDQILEVTLNWILTDADPVTETFYDVIHPLLADTKATVGRVGIHTSWYHNADDKIPIPQGKDGYMKYVILQSWPVLETILVSGGRVEMFNDAYDVSPSEWYNTASTVVDAGGAAQNPMKIPHHVECKADSNFNFYQTMRDDQGQVTTAGICWETAYKGKP
jgi:hypothetical protein